MEKFLQALLSGKKESGVCFFKGSVGNLFLEWISDPLICQKQSCLILMEISE